MQVLHENVQTIDQSNLIAFYVASESEVAGVCSRSVYQCQRVRFLSRVSSSMLTRDIDIAILSVCPSVRDTLVLYEIGLTYRHKEFGFYITFFSPCGSTIIPVLRASNIFTKFTLQGR